MQFKIRRILWCCSVGLTAIAFGPVLFAHTDDSIKAADIASDASELSALHEVEHLFSSATIIAGPSLVDCTLSGGTRSRCFTLTVKAEPSDYTPGPWCPQAITDGPESAGIWFEGGVVHDADGEFLKNLATFYTDNNWQLYDSTTGKINVTDTKESCAAAARPDVDPAYQNHCVQCLTEYMDEDSSVTYTIPIVPVLMVGENQGARDSGSGIAFNGIRLDGPAPVSDILSNYTIAPFDDCGGHVNLNVGYHYHAATDCLEKSGQVNSHGTVVGLAMDGHHIYARLTSPSETPIELDACGGHALDVGNYHYHAGEPGGNAILSCMIAEVGCVSSSMDGDCDASNTRKPRGNGADSQRGRPDFAAAAKKLGVSKSALMEALGGPPPNFEQAAEVLQIDLDELEAVLPPPGR